MTEEEDYMERYKADILVLVGLYGAEEAMGQLEESLYTVNKRIKTGITLDPPHILEAKRAALLEAINNLKAQ